jgi:hypothetical protein
MDKIEYLYFIPLLLYGIALNDLFVQFKLFLQPKFRYAPYLITVVIFIEMTVFNVYEYYEFAKGFNADNYFEYMFYLIPPILSMMLVSSTVINESVEDVAEAYEKTIRYTFILLAVLMAFRLLSSFSSGSDLELPRAVVLVLSLFYAITKRKFFFYLMFAVWAIGVVIRLKMYY